MSPLESFVGWNKRYPSKKHSKQDPYRKYWFLCEGEKTESFYFKKLIKNRKVLGISPNIFVDLLEKTEEDKSKSNPKALIDLADSHMEKFIEDGVFDREYDKIILVFDIDIYKFQKERYFELLSEIESRGYQLGVTNPSFELFLILHHVNAYQSIIVPHKDEIFKNQKTGKGKHGKRYIVRLFSDIYKMNPKSNHEIGDLVLNIENAIKEERNINQSLKFSIVRVQHIGKLKSSAHR